MQARKIKKGGNSSLSEEDVEDLREAFSVFDKDETGKINISELKREMEKLNFGQRNPIIYQLVVELEANEGKKQGGITFEAFIDALNFKLGDFSSKEGLRRLFELFMDDPKAEKITAEAMIKMRDCISETNLRDEDIADIIDRISNDDEGGINFEDFYRYMSRKNTA